MKTTIIDREYKRNPYNLDISVIASISIECDSNEQLIAILSHINSIDINTIMTKKTISNSGVQISDPEHPETTLHSEETTSGSSTEGPISSIEIE